MRAAARAAAGACVCAIRAGRPTAAAVRACGAVVLAAVLPGKAGQVDGAVTMVSFDVLWAIVAVVRVVIAQW